jgi:hypothetical protein
MVPPRKSSDDIVKTNPDPTEAVKEALTLAIANLDAKLTQRMDASDKAVALARAEVIGAAADLAKAYAEALSAALKTTTEANTKLADSFRNESGATNEKIDRLTERINIWTGRDSNMVDTKSDAMADRGHGMSSAALAISGAFLILAVVVALAPHFGK